MTDEPEWDYPEKMWLLPNNADTFGERMSAPRRPYILEDLALATVAAAYEAAALYCTEGFYIIPPENVRQREAAKSIQEQAAKQVLALTPADARAALDAMIEQAKAEEREACLSIIADHTPDRPLASRSTAMNIAAAIRERGK